ncbi:MAG: hypothetical protein ABI640_00515 [Gammaproteobacteria bacterium]
MKHRISAGVIVDVEDRILLARHLKPGAFFSMVGRNVSWRRRTRR